jgi:poly(A) polymerase
LVGGGVRDLLLGKHPKDFDVSTNALPEEVKKLFRNCRLIGRRFRLAHIYFRGSTIEVSTFRAAPNEHAESGMIVRDNVFGNIHDDAFRRDLTINALYYDITHESIIDFTGGMKDLKKRVARMIGDPEKRYAEDPVRMLRAVRFAAKLNFQIEPNTEAPLYQLAHLLEPISPSRLFDELLKLFHGGAAEETFELLCRYNLLKEILPLTNESLIENEAHLMSLVRPGLQDTDKRIRAGKTTAIPFMFALLLWRAVNIQQKNLSNEDMSETQSFVIACREVLREQVRHTTIPKRLQFAIREIWLVQQQLEKRRPKRIYATLNRPRFRAAFDLLALRARSGENVKELVDWWAEIQDVNDKKRHEMIKDLYTRSNKEKS